MYFGQVWGSINMGLVGSDKIEKELCYEVCFLEGGVINQALHFAFCSIFAGWYKGTVVKYIEKSDTIELEFDKEKGIMYKYCLSTETC